MQIVRCVYYRYVLYLHAYVLTVVSVPEGGPEGSGDFFSNGWDGMVVFMSVLLRPCDARSVPFRYFLLFDRQGRWELFVTDGEYV